MTERLARSGNSLASLVSYVWPLLFVVVVLVGMMLVTHDMGPLLIAGYGAGAFVAASVAMWVYQRSRAIAAACVLAVTLFAAWILVTTVGLFQVASLDTVAAARLGKPCGAAGVRQRSAGIGHMVPARRATRRLRPWRGPLVRLRQRTGLRRRAGANPERLHVHRPDRRIRLDCDLGADHWLGRVALRADTRPWKRNARRAEADSQRWPPRE